MEYRVWRIIECCAQRGVSDGARPSLVHSSGGSKSPPKPPPPPTRWRLCISGPHYRPQETAYVEKVSAMRATSPELNLVRTRHAPKYTVRVPNVVSPLICVPWFHR